MSETCSGSVATGALVRLNGVSGDGQSWEGSCVGTADICSLQVDGPTDVILNENPSFSQGGDFGVTVHVTPGGTVKGGKGDGINCSSASPTGCRNDNLEHLNLTAIHAPGYHFAGWSGDYCARFRSSTVCKVPSLESPANVTAKFSRD